MDYTKLYINLERCQERRKNFDDSWERFEASDGKDLEGHPIVNRMCSYWNISKKEHMGKCGCFLSHYRIWEHIVGLRLNNVIVCEDDVVPMNELPPPQELGPYFCYLGGYFSHRRLVEGPLRNVDDFPTSKEGMNELDRSQYRMLMTCAYYIPSWRIAEQLLSWIDSRVRVRALDAMLDSFPYPMSYYYPAIYVEGDGESTIHKKSRVRRKHPDVNYMFV